MALTPSPSWRDLRLASLPSLRLPGALRCAGGLVVLCAALTVVACGESGPGPTAVAEEITVMGGSGRGEGYFHQPRGIEVLPDASCVVIDRSGRVQRFAADGSVITTWILPKWRNGQPIDLTRTPWNTLLVADTHYSRLLEYDFDGTLLEIRFDGWALPGSEPDDESAGLGLVRGVAIGANETIYVADYSVEDRVHRFDRGGNYLSSFGKRGESPTDLNRPEGLTVGRDGTVYVVDCGHHRIQRFDAEGNLIGSFGESGTAPGQFLFPFDIAVGSDDCLYVVEYRGNRIQRFSHDGRYLDGMGAAGREPGEFATPRGIAVLPEAEGDWIYVADTNNHRVQRFRWRGATR